MSKSKILVIGTSDKLGALRMAEKLGIEVEVIDEFTKEVFGLNPSAVLIDDFCEPLECMDDEYEHQDFKCKPNYKEKGYIKPFYRKGRW